MVCRVWRVCVMVCRVWRSMCDGVPCVEGMYDGVPCVEGYVYVCSIHYPNCRMPLYWPDSKRQ